MPWRLPAGGGVLPGMASGAPRRNVLVLIGYVFLVLVATSILFGPF